MTSDVLNPVVTVQVRGETIEVRELAWKDYLKAVKDLASTILKFVGKDNAITLDKDKIIEAITAHEALVDWVLQKSTGRDSKFISSLSARELLTVLQAAVDLNLNEEVIGPGKRLAGKLGNLLGVSLSLKNPLPGPSTGSSTTATASPTSKG